MAPPIWVNIVSSNDLLPDRTKVQGNVTYSEGNRVASSKVILKDMDKTSCYQNAP